MLMRLACYFGVLLVFVALYTSSGNAATIIRGGSVYKKDGTYCQPLRVAICLSDDLEKGNNHAAVLRSLLDTCSESKKIAIIVMYKLGDKGSLIHPAHQEVFEVLTEKSGDFRDWVYPGIKGCLSCTFVPTASAGPGLAVSYPVLISPAGFGVSCQEVMLEALESTLDRNLTPSEKPGFPGRHLVVITNYSPQEMDRLFRYKGDVLDVGTGTVVATTTGKTIEGLGEGREIVNQALAAGSWRGVVAIGTAVDGGGMAVKLIYPNLFYAEPFSAPYRIVGSSGEDDSLRRYLEQSAMLYGDFDKRLMMTPRGAACKVAPRKIEGTVSLSGAVVSSDESPAGGAGAHPPVSMGSVEEPGR